MPAVGELHFLCPVPSRPTPITNIQHTSWLAARLLEQLQPLRLSPIADLAPAARF